MTTSSDASDHPTTSLRRAKPLALALGGGGALGAAHVGVLRALWERDIRPTLVVGTSAGSIVGAAYAAGMPIDEIERTVLQSDWGTFGTLEMRPGIGLLNANGLAATIERIAGRSLTIEELPIPFAAVATDVRSRRPVVIDSGNLADAIAASIAVPGIFRPRKAGKSYLVDGGVVQNLPLQTAFDRGAAHVIGVRLAAEWDVLPQLRTAVEVHELEIDARVTMIRPRLGTRSQWIPSDLPTLVRLGYEAAVRELPPPRGPRARWRSRRPAYGPSAT